MSEEVYTYYFPEEKGEVQRGPLSGKGRVWVRGEYRHPDYPSPYVVRVGDAGIKVWMVIQWLRTSNNDFNDLRRRFGDIVERDDLKAAEWYYQKNKRAIDEKLREEEAAVG